MDDLISRQEAIDILTRMSTDHFYGHRTMEAFRLGAEALSAERREVQSSECEYWDSESNFCSLHRPSAEPRYCDRNICASNEVNGISCDECEIAKYHNLEDDDSICRDCGAGE